MNSSKKVKSSKTKSKTSREWNDELSAILARAEAAAEVNAARVIANPPAIYARRKQEAEEADRAMKEAVRLHEARLKEASLARELLFEALGMLGSDLIGERAAAALMAEEQRIKLGMTWAELIVNDQDDEDFDDDDEDGDDLDDYEGPL